MTLENILIRFVKDKGYYHVIKYQMVNEKRKKLISDTCLGSYILKNEGVKKLFYMVFSYNPLFFGYSRTPKRRTFYKLNKEWKDFVDGKYFLQHNIEIGDTFEVNNFFNRKTKYTVMGIEKNNIISKDEIGHKVNISIFRIKSLLNKNIVNNIYYKDENGIEYGELEGSYNEIQL